MDDYGSDYGDGPSPMRMFGLLGMLAPVVGMLLAASLWGVAILYVIARWRHHRAGVVDSQLGLKFVLHLFRLHGYQLLLLGGFMLLYSILAKGNSEMRSPIWRAAMGFLTAGGVVFGAHTVLLTKTNQAEQPLIGRMYSGLSLLLTGLIAMTGLVLGTRRCSPRATWATRAAASGRWCSSMAPRGWCRARCSRAQLTGPSPDGPGTPGASAPPPPPMPEPMRQPLA
jgi:hypothetical protein